jgi:hypothetical protein
MKYSTKTIAVVLTLPALLIAGQGLAAERQSQSRRPQQQRGDTLQTDPSGWVLIAYDYNQDRRVDAYEYIHAYDLERARQVSRQRPQGQQRAQVRQTPGRARQARTARQQRTGRSPQRQIRVSGTVDNLRMMQLAGQKQAHAFVTLRTRQGRTVAVNLGSVDDLRPLQLRAGDFVQVQGRRVIVNERPVVMAGTVRANNRTIRVQPFRGGRVMRLKGRVTRTATKQLEGGERPAHLVGIVELESGRRVPVDFGRKKNLQDQDVEIQEGRDVVVLAEIMPIGDQQILVARSISLDGRRIDVDWLGRIRRRGATAGRR